ncbi:hypothetical protein Nepgr_006451, partial [Nepenthes gracilis]
GNICGLAMDEIMSILSRTNDIAREALAAGDMEWVDLSLIIDFFKIWICNYVRLISSATQVSFAYVFTKANPYG